jgi:hypothetical protein
MCTEAAREIIDAQSLPDWRRKSRFTNLLRVFTMNALLREENFRPDPEKNWF